MTSKHTPGPWTIDRKHNSSIIKAIGPCEAEEYAGSSWLEVSEADASLIAAAPDLLAALDEAPTPSKYHGANGFDVDQFLADYAVFSAMKRAAIAKARGEA